MSRRLARSFLLTVALGAAAQRAPAVAAPADQRTLAAPTIDVGLYNVAFDVRWAGAEWPDVVVRPPGDAQPLIVSVEPYGWTDATLWRVSCDDPETLDSAGIRPGTTIDVTAAGRTTRTVVPELRAASDAAADVVAGRAPWPGAVTITLRSEPLLGGDESPIPPLTATAGADGAFRLSVRGSADIAEGTWGSAAVVDPDGNRFHATFAQPLLNVPLNNMGHPITVRADGGTPVRLTLLDAAGEVLAQHDGDGYGFDGTQMWYLPFDPGLIGPSWPAPGQSIRAEVDGRTIVEAAVRGARARYDPELGTIKGRAFAGAPVRTLLATIDPAAAESATVADAAGRFLLHAPVRPFRNGTTVPFAARTGPSSIETYIAAAPTEIVRLFDNSVTIAHDGRLPIEIELDPAGAGERLRRTFESPWYGRMGESFDFFDDNGRPVVLRPGDRLTSRPTDGTEVSFAIPSVSARFDAASSALVGDAPPGSIVSGFLTLGPPSVLPLLRPVPDGSQGDESRQASAVAGLDGRYALSCAPPCALAQAVIRASVQLVDPASGRPQAELAYLAAPLRGISVSTADVAGFATAGSEARVALLDDGGRTVETHAAVASQDDLTLPPRWTTAWADRFPDGIPAGTRFAVDVAGNVVELTVPAVPISVDVLADRVTGGGRPGDTVEVWDLLSGADNAGRMPTSATARVGGSGRWTAAFRSFDVRAGDDLLLNFASPDNRTYIQLNALTIDGPREPTRAPTAEPTRPPAGSATPQPDDATWRGRRLFVPLADRGAGR